MEYQHNAFIGNLGRDPESKFTPNGQQVTSFSIAVNHEYNTVSGEHCKETMWVRVEVWGKAAEACNQYLKKGSTVLVEGRLIADKETGGPRMWDKKDGTKGTSFELTASRVVFLDGKKKEEAGDNPF